MTQAIILAGGLSSRAGQNKMTLPFRGKPLVVHAVEAVEPHVDAIIVVTGRYHDDIVAALAGHPKVDFVRNPLYEMGMFSSVRCGVIATTGDVLIMPGDIPLVKPATVAKILAAPGDIRIPVYRHRKGHPVFVAGSLRTALLAEEDDRGLRAFRDRHGYETVDVDDPGVLFDVDTIHDFERLLKKNEGGEPHAD